MRPLFHIVFSAALLCSAAVLRAEQTAPPPSGADGLPQDVLAKGCLEGRGFGTDLLPVSERIARCTALIAIEGQAYDGLLHRARASMSAQDWPGAERDFTAALEVMPQADAAYFERGRVRFLYLEQIDAALGDFARAAALAPDVPPYQMMQALAALELAKAGSEDGEVLSALVSTARDSLTRFLALTEGTEDMGRVVERRAAEDILARLPKSD